MQANTSNKHKLESLLKNVYSAKTQTNQGNQERKIHHKQLILTKE